jgi:very-short-patch-repair endonuclease
VTTQPELVAATAVVRVADHPSHRGRIHRLARTGELVRVLPGTYVPASAVTDRRTRLAAACAWAPHASLWGRSALDAASGCLDPFGRGEHIQLAGAPRHPQPGIDWYAAQVPDRFVTSVGGLRFARPLLAAAALASTDGGVAVDRLLLSDPSAAADLPAVTDWFERRVGNGKRRPVLAEVRQRPWSGLERELHRLLRRARIGGWRANAEVVTVLGRCVTDVLFDAEPLVLEVDSWEYHASQEAFELDRRRQNGLVLSGYRVLRFTAAMITGEPGRVIGAVKGMRRLLRGG